MQEDSGPDQLTPSPSYQGEEEEVFGLTATMDAVSKVMLPPLHISFHSMSRS